MMKHVIIPIFISHRGCPNQCVFCNQKAITARSGDVTVEDAKKIIDEWLSTVDHKTTETEISFFGGSFTGIPIEEQNAFLTLAKGYKDKGLVDKLHCSTRPDYISREILDNLKAFGMDVIELGVQSFDGNVLAKCKRGHSTDDIYRACALIKQYGFTLGIQLMTGLPGDSYESCMYSAEETVKIKPEIARLYPTVVLPDTELSDMYRDGSYVPPNQGEMLRTVKDMYKLLTANGINVIRIGLKSNEMIKGDSYHPAFGQLVKSSVMLDEITKKLEYLKELPNGSTVIITADPSEINFAAGHKGMNKKILQSRYPGVRFRFEKGDAFGVRAE